MQVCLGISLRIQLLFRNLFIFFHIMIDRESGTDPDKTEGDQPCRIQLLMEIETSHQELDRRIDIHQDTCQVIRDLTDPVVEQSQGNRCDDPGEREQQKLWPGQDADASRSVEFAVDAEYQCSWCHHQRFREQRQFWIERELFLDSTVKCKAGADDDRQNRNNAVRSDQIADTDHGKYRGQLFQTTHFFMKYKDSESRHDDRLQKIAEAGIQHMSGIDGIDIHAPVDADEDPA